MGGGTWCVTAMLAKTTLRVVGHWPLAYLQHSTMPAMAWQCPWPEGGALTNACLQWPMKAGFDRWPGRVSLSILTQVDLQKYLFLIEPFVKRETQRQGRVDQEKLTTKRIYDQR